MSGSWTNRADEIEDALVRDRRGDTDPERDDEPEREEPPRVSHARETLLGIGMHSPHPPPPRCRVGGERCEDPAQRALPPIGHGSAHVGVDLARTKHCVARQVDEYGQREDAPDEREEKVRALVGDGDREGQDPDEEERVPESDRCVGEIDVVIAEVGELVPHHRSEGGRVGDLARDQTPVQRHCVGAGTSECKAGRGWVERVPEPAGLLVHSALACELGELVHDRGCVLTRQRPEAAAADDPRREEEHDRRGHDEQQHRAADHPPGKRAGRVVHTCGSDVARSFERAKIRTGRRGCLVCGRAVVVGGFEPVWIEGEDGVEPVPDVEIRAHDGDEQQQEPKGRVGGKDERVESRAE